MKLIYLGPHPGVENPELFEGVAARHGEPVDVQDEIKARSLIARGDFAKYEPEPPRKPVQTTRE